VVRNSCLPRIAPDDIEQRAESKEQKPVFSSPPPNPALKGARGYALVFFPYSVRPRPLARALGFTSESDILSGFIFDVYFKVRRLISKKKRLP